MDDGKAIVEELLHMEVIVEPETELYHHGILGQKWGVRRYQNKDGSLTAAGKRKYGTKTNFEKVQAAKRAAEKANSPEARARAKANARTEAEIAKYKKKAGLKDDSEEETKSSTPKKKSISEMSDQEINDKINRIQLENKLKALQPENVSKGKAFVTSLINDVIAPAAKDAGKSLATDWIKKQGSEILGLNEEKKMSKYERAKKESEYYQNQKSIAENKKAIANIDKTDPDKEYKKKVERAELESRKAKADQTVYNFEKQKAKDAAR